MSLLLCVLYENRFGPTAEGLIPAASVERLAAMGNWMDVNGESIYGTAASSFKSLGWGRCTQKKGKLYLHIFDRPKDGVLVVPGLKNKVKKAYLLAGKKGHSLPVTRKAEDVLIEMPAKTDSPATVIVLEIKGSAQVVDAAVR